MNEHEHMAAVLANLMEQLWGPPHIDNPHDWRDLPAKLTEELAEDNALRNRMSDLLRDVAAGLKGPPPPLTLWDWSDLPVLAAKVTAQLNAIKEHGIPFCIWWGMTEAQEELAGEPIKDDSLILSFSGSGASTMVTARKIRAMLDAIYPVPEEKKKAIDG